MVVFDTVPHRAIEHDVVAIAPTFSVTSDASGRFEVLDDALHGPFGDADLIGEIAQTQARITRQTDQDVGVVGQERPAALVASIVGAFGHPFIIRTKLHELTFLYSESEM
jgi:hypothetical protein